jgi:hypothetical protein
MLHHMIRSTTLPLYVMLCYVMLQCVGGLPASQSPHTVWCPCPHPAEQSPLAAAVALQWEDEDTTLALQPAQRGAAACIHTPSHDTPRCIVLQCVWRLTCIPKPSHCMVPLYTPSCTVVAGCCGCTAVRIPQSHHNGHNERQLPAFTLYHTTHPSALGNNTFGGSPACQSPHIVCCPCTHPAELTSLAAVVAAPPAAAA